MAGAAAEAGQVEEAAERLKIYRVWTNASRLPRNNPAGCAEVTQLRLCSAGGTHAPDPLPENGFAAYIGDQRTIPLRAAGAGKLRA
jgi:hypothetical protein